MAFPLLWVAGSALLGVVLGVVLAGRVKTAPAQPSEFKRPVAQEGRPLPVIFGTVDLREPNCVDFGRASVKPNYVEGGGKK